MKTIDMRFKICYNVFEMTRGVNYETYKRND